MALKESIVNASVEEKRNRVQRAIQERFGRTRVLSDGTQYPEGCWVISTYDEYAVYQNEVGQYRVSYGFAEDGSVTLGEPEEVIATFEPVKESVLEIPNSTHFREVSGTKGREWEVVLIETGLSKNGRYYPAETLKAAVGLFEGVAAFADHATDDERRARPERSVKDKVGVFREAKYQKFTIGGHKGEGIVARFKVLEGWLRDKLLEAFQADEPDFLGFSIDAYGDVQVKEVDGRAVDWVAALTKIQSVDVVTDPAAGGRPVRLVASNRPAVSGAAAQEDGMAFTKEELQQMLEESQQRQAATVAEQIAQAVREAEERMAAKLPIVPVVETVVVPPTEPVTVEDEVKAQLAVLQTQVAESLKLARIEATRNRLATKLAESTLSVPGRAQVEKRIMEAADRRDIPDDELGQAIQETLDYEAAFTQQFSNPVGVGGDRHLIRQGASSKDKIIAGLRGYFDKEDVDGVPRFYDIREAYCRWNGIDSFQFNGMLFMRDLLADYDSELHHAHVSEAMTTSTWGQVFADVMYNSMMRSYSLLPYNGWRSLVSEVERVTDFRVHHWSRIGGYGNLSLVSEGQPYGLATTPGDEEVSYQVAKYGFIDDVTWEATLGDKLNQIQKLPGEMALAAARTLYQFVMNLVTTDNPTMDYDSVALYHSSHGNTGTAALTLGNLQVVSVAMRSQTRYGATDPLGALNLPKILVVPNELEHLALRITDPSDAYGRREGSDTDANLDPQAFKGRGMQVMVNDFLTDANDWYAVADPRIMNTVVIGFLNGRETPELFVQDDPRQGSTFNADKISYKIRMVMGGDILDHRAFYRQVVT